MLCQINSVVGPALAPTIQLKFKFHKQHIFVGTLRAAYAKYTPLQFYYMMDFIWHTLHAASLQTVLKYIYIYELVGGFEED